MVAIKQIAVGALLASVAATAPIDNDNGTKTGVRRSINSSMKCDIICFGLPFSWWRKSSPNKSSAAGVQARGFLSHGWYDIRNTIFSKSVPGNAVTRDITEASESIADVGDGLQSYANEDDRVSTRDAEVAKEELDRQLDAALRTMFNDNGKISARGVEEMYEQLISGGQPSMA